MTVIVEGCLALLHWEGWSAGSARFGSVWQVDVSRGIERHVAIGGTELEAWRRTCELAKAFPELL